jgi:uncharacterized membrane protein
MRDLLPWGAGAVVVGGILHILAVLGLPWLAEGDAFARLSAVTTVNSLQVQKNDEPSPLPFASPDIVHAFCLFDLSERNITVTTPLLEPAWSIAASTRYGENFYLITGGDAKRTSIRLLIIPRDRLAQEVSTERTEEGDEQNIVVSPTSKGILAIRAPLRGESFRTRTLEALSQARCEQQKPFEPAVAAVQEKAVEPQPAATPERGRRNRRQRQ